MKIFICVHVKCLFCQILMKFGLFRQIFEKYLHRKFHENPSSGSRVFLWDGRTDRNTHMSQLMVAFCSFMNATRNGA